MDVVCGLEDVFEGGVVEGHAGDSGLHVGGELAPPQGHHHRRAAGALELRPLLTNVVNQTSGQLTRLTRHDSTQRPLDRFLRSGSEDSHYFRL